jgi:hypothetical protein
MLRQAIRTWQERSELTGIGLVETTPNRDGCSVDATLAHLSRVTPNQFTVELAYPWGDADGGAGAMLGFFPDSCVATGCSADAWSQPDAA